VPTSPSPRTCGGETSSPPSAWCKSRGVEAVHSPRTRISFAFGMGVGTEMSCKGRRGPTVTTALWVAILIVTRLRYGMESKSGKIENLDRERKIDMVNIEEKHYLLTPNMPCIKLYIFLLACWLVLISPPQKKMLWVICKPDLTNQSIT